MVVLKMKSETGDTSISEYIALGAKHYAIETSYHLVVRKAKGVKKCVVKRQITMDDYKNALFHNKVEKREQTSIQSKDHILHTIKRRKIALKSADDKRVEIDNYFTLPHGHIDLQKKK